MTGENAELAVVLGPTNTGKTHLAVERMCAHAGGVMGFPLRLLAREVYDRVVKAKGERQVALVTGEERIVPDGARYFLCTTESMPRDRAFPFLALDEAQMAADPERGHVFTNALLHYRGTAETMILGAETLRPLVRRLLPDARIIHRPRFSTLAHAPPTKLSRLPRRSAVIAFTAEDVYALAELLRRQKGGAAIVMGSLSPRTRNAQVALYQSGEVDYLVATDAIGMGLNMDIAHVAFASLSKFDGRRQRRLATAEMAQIAGRAGRHQRDGSFGTLLFGHGNEAESGRHGQPFTPEEIAAIEEHRFPPLKGLYWRNARLDFSSLQNLIASLEAVPSSPELWRGDDAVDLQVLKLLAEEEDIRRLASGRLPLQRLWGACGLPDYRKTGAKAHARLVGRMFRHLADEEGRLPEQWIAGALAALDNVAGDIATLSDRIAAARTWTYVSHRSDWLPHAAAWAERARKVEDRLSDALHQRLTQRFVDRRTALLLRDRKAADQQLEIDPDGSVLLGGAMLGALDGFRFRPDPAVRGGEAKRLLAVAERRLLPELVQRARALSRAADEEITLAIEKMPAPALLWRAARIATLKPGAGVLAPGILLDHSLDLLPLAERELIRKRLERWLHGAVGRHLAPLLLLEGDRNGAGHGRGAREARLSPAARGLVVQLIEALGMLPRAGVEALVGELDAADRALLRQRRIVFGVRHIYARELLRPLATKLRLALWAAANRIGPLPEGVRAGAPSLVPKKGAPPGYYALLGYWLLGDFAVRVDLADRVARRMHGLRAPAGEALRPDPRWGMELGLRPQSFARFVRALGFRGDMEQGYRPGRKARPAVGRTGAGMAGAGDGAHGPFAGLPAMLSAGRTKGRVGGDS